MTESSLEPGLWTGLRLRKEKQECGFLRRRSGQGRETLTKDTFALLVEKDTRIANFVQLCGRKDVGDLR